MWVRFTERARRMVFFAQEEADSLGENHVATEHLLLGLLREDDHLAARVLKRMRIYPRTVHDELLRRVKPGTGKADTNKQLASDAKGVIELSYDEAGRLSNNYIGTEHLLLGMIREAAGLAGCVLRDLGVDLATARAEIRKLQDETVQVDNAPDTNVMPPIALANQLANDATVNSRTSEPEDPVPTSRRGDIGVLGIGGREYVEFVLNAVDVPAFADMMEIKDEFVYREFFAESRALMLAAGTVVKLLREEKPKLWCVRVLDGDHAGEIGFVMRTHIRDARKDDRPFPPDITESPAK